MDVLAGEFAYYAPMVKPLTIGEISFESIETIRDELCPDGSLTSATIGIAKAWPRPCVLIEAALGYKKSDSDPAQASFGFKAASTPTLRAINVTINEAARLRGMQIFRNFRVPEASITSQIFFAESRFGEALENLSWWKASDGTQLTDLPVMVRARRFGRSVHALIVPTSAPRRRES